MKRKGDGIPGWAPFGNRNLCPRLFTSRLNYLLEVGSFALTVLFPFATFLLSFEPTTANPPLDSEKRFEPFRVSLRTNN